MSLINAASLAHEGGTTRSSGRHFLQASYCRQWEMKLVLFLISLFVTSGWLIYVCLQKKCILSKNSYQNELLSLQL